MHFQIYQRNAQKYAIIRPWVYLRYGSNLRAQCCYREVKKEIIQTLACWIAQFKSSTLSSSPLKCCTLEP